MNKDLIKEKIGFYKNGLTYITTSILLLGGTLASILFFHTELLTNTFKLILFFYGFAIEIVFAISGYLLIKRIRKLIKEL